MPMVSSIDFHAGEASIGSRGATADTGEHLSWGTSVPPSSWAFSTIEWVLLPAIEANEIASGERTLTLSPFNSPGQSPFAGCMINFVGSSRLLVGKPSRTETGSRTCICDAAAADELAVDSSARQCSDLTVRP